MPKIAPFFFLFFILLLLLSACNSSNLLTYKYRLHYHEESVITKDTVFTLFQSIEYNKRNVNDEEHGYALTFKFKDLLAAASKKAVNLAIDTALVETQFNTFSVWYESDKYAVSGEIKILKWNKNKVVLEENVRIVNSSGHEIYYYRGTRKFKRERGR